jgi:hypothetical protein
MNLAAIIALLTAQTGISALLGDRIFEYELPRGYVLPAAAVHTYGAAQDYDFNGPIDIGEHQVQIDVYGKTAAELAAAKTAVRDFFKAYTGTLTDGTVVQAVYLEREMDMPFLPNADTKGIANRSILGFRVVSK